jgi:hypothetical protein
VGAGMVELYLPPPTIRPGLAGRERRGAARA